jgi:hypothetical protein
VKEICCKIPRQSGHDSWDIVRSILSLTAILQLLAFGRGCALLLTAAIGDCRQGTFVIVLGNDQILKVNSVWLRSDPQSSALSGREWANWIGAND